MDSIASVRECGYKMARRNSWVIWTDDQIAQLKIMYPDHSFSTKDLESTFSKDEFILHINQILNHLGLHG